MWNVIEDAYDIKTLGPQKAALIDHTQETSHKWLRSHAGELIFLVTRILV